MKWLYEFAVNNEKEMEQVETSKDEQGNEVKTTKKVKKVVPVKFKILKPTRRMFDDAELFYGVKLSEGIKAGLLTRALLAKRYQNDGGSMSDPEKEKYTKLYIELYTKETEFQKISLNLEGVSPEAKTSRIAQLMVELTDIRQELQNLEFSQISLFDQTAENRARNQCIMWWVLNLAYTLDGKGEPSPLFPGKTYEERISEYDSLEEEESLFWNEVLKKFAYFVSFWYMGKIASQEDFEKAEKFYIPVQQNIDKSENDKKESTPNPSENKQNQEVKTEELKTEEAKTEEVSDSK